MQLNKAEQIQRLSQQSDRFDVSSVERRAWFRGLGTACLFVAAPLAALSYWHVLGRHDHWIWLAGSIALTGFLMVLLNKQRKVGGK